MPDQIQHSEPVKKWLQELELSGKREENFRKEGRRIVSIYEAEKAEETEFNILFSNTETLMPALYNAVPRPEVKRRYNDADQAGKMASNIVKRSLTYLIDSNDRDSSNFDDMIRSATLEALLPGRGVSRFKYDASIEGEGDNAQVKAETVCGEEVPWDRFRMGYAKKWTDLPWIAFEHFMTKAEIESNFGEGKATGMLFSIRQGNEDKDKGESDSKGEEGGELLAHVFEIWDKSSKKVLFVSPGAAEVIKEADDPLGLSGFFPCPKPLQLTAKVSDLLPVPLYKMYEKQAEELNYVTVRINKIMRALKVRGFYDGSLQGLNDLMSSADNTLLPAENVASMVQGQTIDKAIWFFPVEKLVGVLQQLYVQRDQIKNTIYEITGVSDILRGSSVASETATAQNLKNQWGTLRLKRAQKEVARYVRDCLRIMGEITVEKLDAKTIAAMTGLQYPTAEQKQQAQTALQQFQQQAAQAQAAGQQVPSPPGMEKLQEVVGMPTWEDLLAMLQSDLQRNYRIDIETNSTVDAEATEDKTDVAEFLNAISQFLNGIAPMIEQGYMQFDVAKTMLLAIVRRFRFGTEVEDQINAMQAPAPKGPESDPKLQADKAKMEMQMQMDKQEMAHQQEMQQMELELKKAEMAMKMEELEMKRQLMQAKHAADIEALQTKNALAQANAQTQAAGMQRQEQLAEQQHGHAQENMARDAALAEQQAAQAQKEAKQPTETKGE
jgi:hypothetical protein